MSSEVVETGNVVDEATRNGLKLFHYSTGSGLRLLTECDCDDPKNPEKPRVCHVTMKVDQADLERGFADRVAADLERMP